MEKMKHDIIEKVLNGIGTEEEARAVAEWFATEEGESYLSEQMNNKFGEIKDGYEDILVDHPIPTEKIFNKIETNIARKRIKKILFRCAAVLIPFALILGFFHELDSRIELFGEVDYEEVYVPKGERMQMMFQDGTRAYLNSDTRLKFPKKFSFSERKVFISGEAYFIVTKNPKRPFIVSMNDMSVKVLGTSFNINAYPKKNDVTVFLDEGKIALTSPAKEQYILNPQEEFIYNKESGKCTINKIKKSEHISVWKNNIISFHDAPFSEVIKTLNRWYNIDFVVDNPEVLNNYLTITCENTNLENVLKGLENIIPVRFIREDNRIRIVAMQKK